MSEIRVDTISEKTSANGVAIDSVTLKDGGATLTDNITFSASGKGVHLGVTSATASNLLDDYETGSFTPTLQTSSNTAGNAQSTGTYIKVGDMVYASGWVILNNATSFDGTASRTLRISLPFTAVNTSLLYQGSWSIPYYADITLDSGYYGLGGYSVNNEALIRIMQNGGAGVFALKEGKLDNDGFTFMFGGCFRVV